MQGETSSAYSALISCGIEQSSDRSWRAKVLQLNRYRKYLLARSVPYGSGAKNRPTCETLEPPYILQSWKSGFQPPAIDLPGSGLVWEMISSFSGPVAGFLGVK